MKSSRCLALLVLLAATAPLRAELLIRQLFIGADAEIDHRQLGTGPNLQSNLEDVLGTPDRIDDDVPNAPNSFPQVVSSTDSLGGAFATALQTKNGYFKNRAALLGGSNSPAEVAANSYYMLVVGTNTPNTPLILDFDFLGAKTRASAYYQTGHIEATVSQSIRAELHATGTTNSNFSSIEFVNWAWEFKDTLKLDAGAFTHTQNSIDMYHIGLPTVTATPIVSPFGFSSGLQIERAAFHGTLDFGLLQPGEEFVLAYLASATTYTYGTFPGQEAYIEATIVDPFSLGGSPPAQLSLRGLDLPAIPEPSTAWLALTGLVVCARRLRRAA